MKDPREVTRGEELAVEAAVFGLDAEEHAELDALDVPEALRLELELLAASVAVAAHEAHEARGERMEPLPAALAEKILAPRMEPLTAAVAAKILAPARAEPEPRALDGKPRSAPPGGEVPPAASRPRRRSAPVAGWLVASAAMALAVAGWTRRPAEVNGGASPTAAVLDAAPPGAVSQREALLALPGTARVDWKITKDEAGAQASGDVVWHSGVQRGVMRFAGLAPNDPARFQYQLWIFDETRGDEPPIDGGVFDVGANGELLVPFAAKLRVGKAKLFAVTVEKPGGVVVSKRERIVVTATPPAT